MPEDAADNVSPEVPATPVHPSPATAPDIPQPPPAPKSIFDVIYGATDVNSPRQRISEDVRGLIKNSALDGDYDFIFLYDEYSQIGRFTSNRIYSAITGGSHNPAKKLFLLLH